MGFPEDARVVVLSDCSLGGVVAEDLAFFSGLQFLDVSENYLRLEDFGPVPRLKELRFACNGIGDLPAALPGFAKLHILDLSYNQLSQDGVRSLYQLPCLRDLDLCGNDLRSLPNDMYRFASLERLALENNKIQDGFVFEVLARMPRLRELNLAYNALTEFPARALMRPTDYR
jgi:Leucine-rich repeat (LRR) protein